MHILLHGATNNGSTNFGDFIYGYEVYNMCRNLGCKVSFYQPSKFFIDFIDGVSLTNVNMDDIDMLVYIPGGYFIEDRFATLKDSLYRFNRYFPIGLKCINKNKCVAVIGIDAGPIKSFLVKWAIKKIIKNACLVTVRNNESRLFLQNYFGISFENYYDMILSFPLKKREKPSSQIQAIIRLAKGKKIILVHYNSSEEAASLFVASLNFAVEDKSKYLVVVTSDSFVSNSNDMFELFKRNYKGEAVYYNYYDPFEILSLINISDFILTCKLHLGVVGTMYNKSVLCSAIHFEKTKRYYNQIKQTDRCVNLNKTNYIEFGKKINDFLDKRVIIPFEVIMKSKEHWNKLRNEIIKRMID